MALIHHKPLRKILPKCRWGFTLLETMIAGFIMATMLAAIGRMNIATLAESGSLRERQRIEEAIENHIQLVQQADSLLTYDAVPDEHRNGASGVTRACRKPAEYLATALQQGGNLSSNDWQSDSEVSDIQLFPSIEQPSTKKTSIETLYEVDEDKAIVHIKYRFEAPEENIGMEQRQLELSPNFQSSCPPYEAVND